MAPSGWKVGFVLGTFVLAAALFFPILIEAGQSTTSNTQKLTQGEYTNITENLAVNPINVNDSGDESTIEYRDNGNYSTVQVYLNETTPLENKTVKLSGENITAELVSIEDNNTILLNSTYDPKFGWNDQATTLWENMGLFVALLALAMVGGVLVVVLTKV